jgi:hypothetical protein
LIIAGSKRYWPAYVTMSKAIRQMALHKANPDDEAFPKPFPILAGMPSRHERCASMMHPQCEIESCSFLMYLSDFDFTQESID